MRIPLFLLFLLLLSLPCGPGQAQSAPMNKAGVEIEAELSERDAAHLAALHPGWVRLHVHWDRVETAPGVYDWEAEEVRRVNEILAAARKVQARVLLTVKAAPAFYRSLPDRCSRPDTNGGEAALGHFILALADRFPDVKDFEIWNEPDVPVGLENQDFLGCFIEGDGALAAGRYYGRLARQVERIVEASRGDVQLVGPGLLGSMAFLDGVLAVGGGSLDAISFHHYEAFRSPEGVQYDIAHLQAVVDQIAEYQRRYDLSLPLILSETSLRCVLPPAWTGSAHQCSNFPQFYEQQREWLRAVNAWAAGREDVPGYIWYTAQSNGWDDTDLVFSGGRKKPVFYEFSRITAPFRPPVGETSRPNLSLTFRLN